MNNKGLNIKLLLELQPKIEEAARKEREELLLQYISEGILKEDVVIAKEHKKIPQSPRVLNNWAKNGIIDPSDNGKWRKYNRLESIWIEIVSQLREFGLGLDKIKDVRKKMFTISNTVSNYSVIEHHLIHSIITEPSILLVFFDGNSNIMSKSQYIEYLQIQSLPPHIHINILKLAEKEFPNNNFETIGSTSKEKLSKNEIELLYYLRTGEYNTVTVRMKNGEGYLIEAENELNPNDRVIDIIKKCEYQDISVKVRGGKLVQIKSKEQKKI